ncbi:Recombination endonuclease VII [uncultured archaeon]|nr:Recombination endonuclease VII [uncultured archaeon]
MKLGVGRTCQDVPVCFRCKKTGDEIGNDQFLRKANGRWKSYCRSCASLYFKDYKLAHPELKKWNNQRDGLIGRCRRRGITVEQYQDKFIEQDGKCAICGILLEDGKRGAGATIDHDHQTNEFRGILCALCNKALGCFKESVETLGKAILYVQNTSNRHLR